MDFGIGIGRVRTVLVILLFSINSGASLVERLFLLEDWESKSMLERVVAVNEAVNNLIYLSDILNWGVEDYWATPEETLGKGSGDCEDLAILKYFMLRELGVGSDRLRITAAYLGGGREVVHAFLVYDGVFVLDNIVKGITNLGERMDLHILYEVNEEGFWYYGFRVPYYFKKWESMLDRRGEI